MSSRPCASSEGWLLGCSPLPSPFFPLASSAHYLLDFCHIPDKHLVIDEIQELLQLAQVRDKAFPNFLKEGIKRGVFHLRDISPHPQVPCEGKEPDPNFCNSLASSSPETLKLSRPHTYTCNRHAPSGLSSLTPARPFPSGSVQDL